jgi:hypothetical protein
VYHLLFLYGFLLKWDLLKDNVYFEHLLIGAEGAQTPPKMLPHFHRAWAGSKKLFKVLRAHLTPKEESGL